MAGDDTFSTSQLIPTQTEIQQDDLLWRQLKTIPAFRGILRAVESRFYFSIDLPEPILDVGCGDGHFSYMTFSNQLNAGIDPWWNPLKKSQQAGMYDVLTQAMGDQLPFPDNHFASAFSNSVLEHILDIQPVLQEVNRVLQPNGRFLITMPSQYFTDWLGGAELLEKIGAAGLAERYRHFFNGISRHAHTDSPQLWGGRLADAGFEIERWQYYFSKKALHALEVGHAQGVPAAVMHALTGHWIVAPWESSLRWTERWLRPFYEEEFGEAGAYLLIIARKIKEGPAVTSMPPACPFTIAELEANLPYNNRPVLPEVEVLAPTTTPAAMAAPFTHSEIAVAADRLPITSPPADAIPAAVTNAQDEPAASDTPGVLFVGPGKRRWLFPLAFILVMLASRLASGSGGIQSLIAILIWIGAGALGFYSLSTNEGESASSYFPGLDRFTAVTATILFASALILRLVSLSSQPFILNGIEASLGLNALEIIEGSLRNPFGTGWLTNPNLPIYLMALPVRIFGPSIWSVRLLSPFVGSLTVVVLFLIASRLFGRSVGLVAAIFLLGSSYHLQYSRLGLTNIWDPLLVLLALGLSAIAWERQAAAPGQRIRWLWAGLAVGLNAYGFTSLRLLPIMLLVLVVLMFIFNNRMLRRQAPHLLAAFGLALVIALPAILYYFNNSAIFFDRANAVGIFASQSDYLNSQAAQTGRSPTDILLTQFWQTALAFNGARDGSPTYRPDGALLNFVTSLLFLVGLAISLLRLRQYKFAMLFVWVLVTLLFAGAFLLEPPQSHRLLLALPAVMLLAGIALVEIVKKGLTLLRPAEAKRPSARVTLSLLVVLALILALGDIFFYFYRYPQAHEFGDRNTETAHVLTEYMNNLSGTPSAYFYGPPFMYTDFPTFSFLLTDDAQRANFINIEPGATAPANETPNQIFIFLPERSEELTTVQTAFPGGQLESFSGHYRQPLFQVYTVP